jgi:hypothetical protein
MPITAGGGPPTRRQAATCSEPNPSRASTPSAEEKLALAGADRIVSPYAMAGRRLAELAIRPRVVDFLDAALSHGEISFSLEELHVTADGLDGETVAGLRARGLFVLAILTEDGRYAANPPDDRRLAIGETITYDLVITVAEGTTTLLLLDNAPVGSSVMEILSASLFSVGANLTVGTPTITIRPALLTELAIIAVLARTATR